MYGRIKVKPISILLLVVTVLWGAIFLGACQPDNGGQTVLPERDIKTVMEAHVDSLMVIPGVTGVAIGQLDDGTPCIVIYIMKESDELRQRLPERLEGHPVRIEVSGEFKPL